MELKYIKTDFNKFKIEYKGTQFKDINEYVIDLKNIFTQMLETYKKFTTDEKSIFDKKKVEEFRALKIEQLREMQEELQNKLNYITDSNKISETVVGKMRGKLMQLKSLNITIDITRDTGKNITMLWNFFNKRILEQNLTVTQKIHYHQ